MTKSSIVPQREYRKESRPKTQDVVMIHLSYCEEEFYLYISKLNAGHALRYLVTVSYNPGVCNDERMSGTRYVCYANEESSFR